MVAADENMQKILIVDEDRGALHSLVADIADMQLRIEICTDLNGAASRVARDAIDIVVLACRTSAAVVALRELQRKHPRTVCLLSGTAVELQQVRPLLKDLQVFRLVRQPWTTGELRSAIADARSYRTLQLAAATANERLREMEKTHAIGAVGSVDFGPDGTVVLDDNTRIEDLRQFDFGDLKSRH